MSRPLDVGAICPACAAPLGVALDACSGCEWTRAEGGLRGWEAGLVEQALDQLPAMDHSALMALLCGVRREARSRRQGGAA